MSKFSLFISVVLAACGPSAIPDHFGNGDAAGSGGGGGGGGGGGSSCATSTVSAQVSPLDIYVMLDQSGSMKDSVSGGGTKWTAVTGALKSFLTQPNLTGFSVGIQYFGLGAFTDSCAASDYATAEVEIAALPGAASALTTSINAHTPTTGTPTSAALQGAVDHAKTWASAHTGDVTAVVFATDGDPSECDTNLSHIDAIAAAAWNSTPKVATFVIGVGSSLSSLNGIAAAGGTTSAFLVDTNANVNQQFIDAMNAIRNSASCTYQIPIPTTGTVDYNQVNIVFTPNGGSPITIPKVDTKAACPATGDGWYYDNNTTPTAIILCETTCGSVQSSGTVQITLGCDTVIL